MEEQKPVGPEIDRSRIKLDYDTYRAYVAEMHRGAQDGTLTMSRIDEIHELVWQIIEANGGIVKNMGGYEKQLLDVCGNYRRELKAK